VLIILTRIISVEMGVSGTFELALARCLVVTDAASHIFENKGELLQVRRPGGDTNYLLCVIFSSIAISRHPIVFSKNV